jgi:hypothetical protein
VKNATVIQKSVDVIATKQMIVDEKMRLEAELKEARERFSAAVHAMNEYNYSPLRFSSTSYANRVREEGRRRRKETHLQMLEDAAR